MGHYRQCSCMTMSRSNYQALRSDRGQVHPDKIQNQLCGGDFGSDQNFFDMPQGPIIVHDCAQYERIPIIHI